MTDLKARYYGQRADRQQLFSRLVGRYLDVDCDVLCVGCGSDNSIKFRARSRLVIGIDLDVRIASNSELDIPILGDLHKLPLPDTSVDLVVSRWVAEHLQDPLQAFLEISRVLRPNGRFVVMTPNVLHYAVAATRLTPHELQQCFARVALKTDPDDVYPTYLRANTLGKLRWLGAQSGLLEESVEMFEGAPMYLAFSPLLFMLGVAYERLVNRFHILNRLRSVIIIAYRKAGQV